MAKKVLVADKIARGGIEALEAKGFEVEERFGMTPEELKEVIGDYDALIVRSATQVTSDVLAAGGKLKIVGRAGVTVDNIDIDAATEAGIIVCNAPTSNIVSTAEHTIALMLACARHIPQASASMKAGKWERAGFIGDELFGATLAIFGLGRIGGLVAERARAFGMRLIGFDPYCRPERAEALGVELFADMEDVLAQADFITVHMPKTPDTIGMFGPDEFAAMKDGVVLVNTARGGIYDVKALADFVAAGKIGAAAIDMFEEEPCLDSPLHGFDNVILTPRLAAATRQARERASVQICEDVASGLEGSLVSTALNLRPVSPEAESQVGPYVPTCQMMGRILAQLSSGLPSNLTVTAAGTLMGADLSLLLAGALAGILSYKSDSVVTPSNAEAIAHRHGVNATARSEYDAHEYASLVTLQADDLEVSAMISGPASHTRLVSLLGYRLDIAPAKHSLVFEYGDEPGRIGIIGTVLGEAGINISTMQIGTNDREECALVYLNVDREVSDEVVAELRERLGDVNNLWRLKL
ncbi:phosphoglycerate dehydrogenase [Xiamenia xianingshaonis]|uniref:D-3-phosphoglycerate dehydrogenase n=1 Tax=Xiamenia xianingshaonis TaxID=2682776 RepID=A0A9E6MRB4_9ACTN|nr:phosphoglycerate dehydrogenase [Xiamenia xianingshaonis]NGM16626.1 phosphoglycerate dehydrogenase [Eggerthellaceae bacterium zg-893]NHM14545.1 phosphoglycerate dehydrogenase [Xiamenia xianingshaonis]NHM16138.1 phosphoglycerate dehydrogenase [Xiamenia xianingshaonis]QTU85004.1 phosphoglycerate dehydrogenase [Xiamenia xianingshaonis]